MLFDLFPRINPTARDDRNDFAVSVGVLELPRYPLDAEERHGAVLLFRSGEASTLQHGQVADGRLSGHCRSAHSVVGANGEPHRTAARRWLSAKDYIAPASTAA